MTNGRFGIFHLRAKHAKHQASTRTKLRFVILSVSFLRVKSGCAVVIVRTSEALGNAQPRVAVASAPFEQLGIDIYFDFV